MTDRLQYNRTMVGNDWVKSLQHERNLEVSRGLERVEYAVDLRKRRHREILSFTSEFLERPQKGFFGRLLYNILLKAAEKTMEQE